MKVPAIAAGVVLLAALIYAATSPAENPKPEKPADHELYIALTSPQSFMFTGQVTTKLETNHDLWITSARNADNRPEEIPVRPATVRIFRADASVDGITKEGGIYWKCGEKKGTVKMKQPGALIMVVRDADGTVHWYSLMPDERC